MNLEQGGIKVFLSAGFIFLGLDSMVQSYLAMIPWVYILAAEMALERQ